MDIDFAPLFQRWYELNFEKALGIHFKNSPHQ